MYKSAIVHLKNKYPGGHVEATENSIDAYDSAGAYVVAIRKNGADQFVDVSKEVGARDTFCLAPIPKEARVHKLHRDGTLGLDEKHEERAKHKLAIDGRVPSILEIELSKEVV